MQDFNYICGMIELSQHIENLLLENDCVVIPRLGGFIAHYQPATYVEEEGLFLPPTRVVGFNPQLRMNDGLLVQSFMDVYGTNFSDANRMIERKVDKLLEQLHENGKAELPQIGELRYSIYDKVSFIAYDNKLTTPALYGLGSFEMLPLKSLVKPVAAKPAAPATLRIVKTEEDKPVEKERTIKLQTNHRKMRIGPAWAAAMVAVVVLAFFYIYPFDKVTPTQQYAAERAELVPTEQLVKAVVEKVDQPLVQPVAQEETMQQEPIRKEITPIITTEEIVAPKVEVEQPQPQVRKRYHVIVASVATEGEVHTMVDRLKSAGNDEAQAIIGGGRMRVSIASYATMAEASEAATQYQATYKGAWVLKK